MKNACIVGYGAIGPVHANAIANTEKANLYAVCEINPERAKRCTDKYSCILYTNYDEMLTDEAIDVVHICTPHYLHKDMAIKALKAGKHVILEKPVAMNRTEMQELTAYYDSDECRTKMCIMLQNRTNACVHKMRDILLNDDETGKLSGIIATLSWKRDEAYYNQDEWRGKWATEGGGLLINQAVHLMDLMVYFGGKIESIKSNISRWKVTNIEVEDTANALIKYESGIYGVFNATNCHSCNSPFYLELQFEKMLLRYADGALYRICGDNIDIIERDNKAAVGKAYWGRGHEGVVDAFYESLEGNEQPYTDIHDATEAMNMVFSMYEKGLTE